MRPHSFYHLHRRQRKHLHLAPFPHPKVSIRFLDNVLMIVGIIAPFFTLPQIWKIWNEGAAGVSLLTWIPLTLFSIPWIIYGLVHQEKIIIISNILWLLFDGIVVVLTLMY